MDAMAAIRQTFFQECEEQLAETQAGLQAMSDGVTDLETVNAVFRAVHSIKGGAGAFKLEALVKFAHGFETVLDLIRSNKLAPGQDVMKVMLRASDVLCDLVAAAREGTTVPDDSYAAVAEDIRLLANGGQDEAPEEDVEIDFTPMAIDFGDTAMPDVPAQPAIRTYTINFRPRAGLYENGNEPLLLLRELAKLGDLRITCESGTLPPLSELDPNAGYLSWTMELATEKAREDIEGIFEFVEGEADIRIECPDEPAGPADADIAALIQSVLDTPVTETIETPAPAAELQSDTVSADPANAASDGPLATASSFPSESAAAPAAVAAQKMAAAPAAQATIRVEYERVDRLVNLVGELVINQAMLAQRVIEANVAGTSSIVMGLDELEQLTREIQEGVMAIRAQPVKPLFQRMQRIVREVADATGKQVRLKTEGESTEVDSTVVERLAEPLTHMIRNAVDHGIERPESREQNGKSAEGVVRLTAVHRSGRIIIEIEDDGAGINRPKVRESAIKKGLISADTPLTDGEIDNLLFLPGFSTAATVSNISGRGVGMDVVKRSIQALGGRIGISSRPGKGSTFSLSLPLTLAVLDGMVVSVAQQTFVVPLTAIIETLKPKKNEIHALGTDGFVMSIRNSFIPLIDVGQALGLQSHRTVPETGVAILVETEGGARSALLVDAIQDQRQVVIKSLESNYKTVPGIAAATILGDGRVALILDVDGLVRLSGGTPEATELRYASGGF